MTMFPPFKIFSLYEPLRKRTSNRSMSLLYPWPDPTDARIKQLEADLAAKDTEIAELTEDLNLARGQRSAAHRRIDELTAEVERLRAGWMAAECTSHIQYDEGEPTGFLNWEEVINIVDKREFQE